MTSEGSPEEPDSATAQLTLEDVWERTLDGGQEIVTDGGTVEDGSEQSANPALIKLLDWVETRKGERQQEFNEFEELTPREQAHGGYVELNNVADRLRDQIEDSGPECDHCGVRMDLRRDNRVKSGFRWDCRHCEESAKIRLVETRNNRSSSTETGQEGSQ